MSASVHPAAAATTLDLSAEVSGLVRRAQAGDRAAFEALYHRHAGRVYALCLRLAGDSVEAEELTQDAFIRAWRGLATFRGDAAFGSWLHRLTVNVVMQRQRTDRRRRARVLPMAQLPSATARSTETGTRLDLETALQGLPDGAREVFVLHDVEGYTHEEIGSMLDIAPGTSKAHLHRARRKLRAVLDR